MNFFPFSQFQKCFRECPLMMPNIWVGIMNLSKRRNKLYCVDSKEYYFIEIKAPYVASRNTCYYSENQFFLFFKISNTNMPHIFF